MSDEKLPDRLYFAYGSNLSLTQMNDRCPGAIPLRQHTLAGWRLAFVGEDSRWGQGGVATIIPAPGEVVHGALYLLDDTHEAALDGFEGVNHAQPQAGHYIKDYASVLAQEGNALVYIATRVRGEANKPNARYLDVIRAGYRDWGIPEEPLAGIDTYPAE